MINSDNKKKNLNDIFMQEPEEKELIDEDYLDDEE